MPRDENMLPQILPLFTGACVILNMLKALQGQGP